jgi:hypothetical protein
MKDGYSFASKDNGCVISKNEIFMAFTSIVNELFILNLDDALLMADKYQFLTVNIT